MYFLSMPILASSGVYYAFENSDWVGKGIVLLMLAGSIVAWSIMFEKWISLKRMFSSSDQFIKSFRKKKYFVLGMAEAKKNPGPAAKIYLAAMENILDIYGMNEAKAGAMAATGARPEVVLGKAQIALIRATIDKELSEQIKVLESRMGMLATCVSAAPFFGLFGTVWGVMLAFSSLAEKGRAEIGSLAPGVAGALLTTVAGLVVAIPSLIGYNLLTALINSLIADLENFADQMLAQLQVEQLEYEDRRFVPAPENAPKILVPSPDVAYSPLSEQSDPFNSSSN
ncbi:MAG: MotA/TolQ/ExbB proton channel family protein [Victivallaceae bacterium]|nr:MotA/TolQ/ExbB proton channel family protein [Victivallaceae bacterium]